MGRAGKVRVGVVVWWTLVAVMILYLGAGLFLATGPHPNGKVIVHRVFGSLDQALVSYRNTFGHLPPSDDAAVGSGAECLYYYLMGPRGRGWSPDPADGGVPAMNTWGPAKELDQEWMVGGGSGGVRRDFVDGDPSEPKPILYYRANCDAQPDGKRPVRYDQIYNRLDNARFWTPTDTEWRRYIVNPDSPNESSYRPSSYLLITAGENRAFGYMDGETDDQTNFERCN